MTFRVHALFNYATYWIFPKVEMKMIPKIHFRFLAILVSWDYIISSNEFVRHFIYFHNTSDAM